MWLKCSRIIQRKFFSRPFETQNMAATEKKKLYLSSF